ncbi:MAG: ABC transporter permease [Clostridiales bacterium]|nr:ABC transporter permease [Clostridiales bacterium]
MFKSLMIITKKELRRVFTDRRLVITSFILPMLSIALIYSMMGYMIQRSQDDIESHVSRVIGSDVPLAIINMIDDDDSIEFISGDFDKETAQQLILDEEYDYYLYFDPEFEDKLSAFEAGQLPYIEGAYSPKSDQSIDANYKMGSLLEKYRQNVLAERIGDASYLQVYELVTSSIDIPEENQGIDRGIANLVPMLVSIFIFAGAMGIGMDSIAGEKERGTIATMLLTPVDRGVIIGGKVISLSVVALISMISSFVGVLISIPFSANFLSASGAFEMSQLSLGGADFLMFFISMIGLVGMYVTIISVLSMIANSLKEAGAYITPAYMVVMIAGFMNMFGAGTVNEVNYFIPIYNNMINMQQVLLGDGDFGKVMISFATSSVVTLILLSLARNLMHKEKVMFPS